MFNPELSAMNFGRQLVGTESAVKILLCIAILSIHHAHVIGFVCGSRIAPAVEGYSVRLHVTR